ncbi:MAG: hypothetical protein U9N52_03465, partial [Campylobacterota bacterium]|nr:hypothetical protein [Campylobacterota bacterium]
MIVVNAKETKEPSGLSQLLLGKKESYDEKFSKLLEAFNLETDIESEAFSTRVVTLKNESIEQNTPQVLVHSSQVASNDEVVKTDEGNSKNVPLKDMTLMHLLQGETLEVAESKSLDTPAQNSSSLEDDMAFLHPKMINTLDANEIKLVVNMAKGYLKEQINTIIKEQNIDIKKIPQTLKGLSELAQKLGVNLEKITLEDTSYPKATPQAQQSKEPQPLLNMAKQVSSSQLTPQKRNFVHTEKSEVKNPDQALQNALNLTKKAQV